MESQSSWGLGLTCAAQAAASLLAAAAALLVGWTGLCYSSQKDFGLGCAMTGRSGIHNNGSLKLAVQIS